MPDMKEMSFMLLVLLVAVSGVYEWAKTDKVLNKELGISGIAGFESATLLSDVNTLSISSNNLVSTVVRADFFNFIGALSSFFGSIWNIFMKLMFGWVGLINAVFESTGLEGLDVIFIAPLAVIEMFAALYFLRDIVNTVRGVG